MANRQVFFPEKMVVANLGYVAFQVPDLNRTVDWLKTILGMREVERVNGSSYLTNGSKHHIVQFIQSDQTVMDHVGLEVYDLAALDRLVENLHRVNIPLLPNPPMRGVEEAVCFRSPMGAIFVAYANMKDDYPPYDFMGVRPRRLGHINLVCEDLESMGHFLTEVLGFRLSDLGAVNGQIKIGFYRCNAEHHAITLIHGPNSFNHIALECFSREDLMNIGDRLNFHQSGFLFGPIRQGLSENISCFQFIPGGIIFESFVEMKQIYNEGTYKSQMYKSRGTLNAWSFYDGEKTKEEDDKTIQKLLTRSIGVATEYHP